MGVKLVKAVGWDVGAPLATEPSAHARYGG